MRWTVLLLLLAGCPYDEAWLVGDVDVGYPDEEGTLDCDAAADAVDTVLLGQGWALVDEDRPVWSPDVQHLGNATVYTHQGVEVMVVATADQGVAFAWNQGTASSCPMRDYGGTCDEAWCGEEVADPCAHLLQAPCDVTWDSDYYRAPTLDFLRDLD